MRARAPLLPARCLLLGLGLVVVSTACGDDQPASPLVSEAGEAPGAGAGESGPRGEGMGAPVDLEREDPAVPSAPGEDPAQPAARDPRPSQPTVAASFPCIPGDAAQGATHYASLCASCHGARGDGQGPAAAGLNPKPARHDDGAVMNELSNDYVFKIIKEGGAAVGKSPLMAPWGGTLTDAQVWDVVAFVRSLAEPDYTCP